MRRSPACDGGAWDTQGPMGAKRQKYLESGWAVGWETSRHDRAGVEVMVRTFVFILRSIKLTKLLGKEIL